MPPYFSILKKFQQEKGIKNLNEWTTWTTEQDWTEQNRAEQSRTSQTEKFEKWNVKKLLTKYNTITNRYMILPFFHDFFIQFQCSVITEWVNHFFKILKWTSYLIHIPKVSITLISWTGKSLAKHCDAETAFWYYSHRQH